MPVDRDAYHFERILNFRDVTAATEQCHRGNRIRAGQLYRSARPDLASAADRGKITDRLKIKTIIDLRSKTEHIEAAQKLQDSDLSTTPPSDRKTNDELANEVKIRGIRYAEINLNGKGFERNLIWKLSYWDLASLAGYMLLGHRLQGISIIGKNVLQPRGLIGLGMDTLDHSGPEIKEVFDVLSKESSYPVLIHCTQGKDRTGLIVILVLLLCGVELDAVKADYILSEAELQPELEERLKEISSIGLDESFAKCPPDFVPRISSFLDDNYGGVENYLKHINISSEQCDRIRQYLVL